MTNAKGKSNNKALTPLLQRVLNYFKPQKKLSQDLQTAALQEIIDLLPGHVYWYDKNGVYYGCNNQQAKAFGFSKSDDLIGKRSYDLQTPEEVAILKTTNEMVFRTGEIQTAEEPATTYYGGKDLVFLSKKVPWKNEKGEIIGVLGVSFDITEEKRLRNELLEAKAQTENTLTNIKNLIPGHVYWKDVNGVYLGCNNFQAKSLGFENELEIIGKTDFELPGKEGDAEKFRENDLYVMQHKKSMAFEETSVVNGKPAIVLSQKTHLEDGNGHVFGILGVSLDITDRKEKEELRLENELHKQALDQQEKFTKLAAQVAHDIASPTAALSMLVNACDDIPEEARLLLRNTATRINDIACNLLAQYQSHRTHVSTPTVKEDVLLSANILQILAEKKLQYAHRAIVFDYQSNQISNFAFIKISISDFKRMLSNVINNAVDAISIDEGQITVVLDSVDDSIKITVNDNGKGMPQEIVNKILNNINVTAGKVDGHGIGLMQVRETLQNSQGSLSIESIINQGTKVTLTFPRIVTPAWLVEEIVFAPQDIIVILDDDKSIHRAWNSRFIPILKNYPGIKIKHFEEGAQALEFIQSMAPMDQQRILLLTDYELLKQELNGLDVIEQSQISHSILVTSHYANAKIRERAEKIGSKVLPKQLAAEISIKIKQ